MKRGAAIWTPWAHLAATARVPQGRADATSLTEEERRDQANEFLCEWWNDQERVLHVAPESTVFIYLGEVDPYRIKGTMEVGVRVSDFDPAVKVFVFYTVDPQQKTPRNFQLSIRVLGCGPRQIFDYPDGTARLDELLKDASVGYEEFWSHRPKLRKIKEAIRDPETKALIERELWMYEEDLVENTVILDHIMLKRRLFIFPVHSVAMPYFGWRLPVVPKYVNLRRNAYFVGESTWNDTQGEEERWAIWDEEINPPGEETPSDGVNPSVLQVAHKDAVLSAYFVGGVTSAFWPDSYAELRAKTELSYLRYRLDRGKFSTNETNAIALLEHNGCSEWIAGVASAEDVALFAKIYPTHTPPKYAGWVPAAKCPPHFIGQRVMRQCKVRFFYPDIEFVVARLMELDQRRINGAVEEAPDH